MPLLQFLKKRGNVAALADWVGKVGFRGALRHVAKHVTGGDVERAKKVTGKLKGMAHKRGTLAPEHAYGKHAKKAGGAFMEGGPEGASGKPAGSPPTTPGDKPGREAATHAELAKPPVKGEHFEPDEDQVGGPPEGDKDDKTLTRSLVATLLAKARKPPLGSGERFAQLKGKLAKRKGIRDPGALAAHIGRKKYGAKKFANLAKKSGGPECGPKSIGTTRSGKQVFGIPSHSGHWKYSADDHDDAARLHEEAGRKTEATIHRHKAQKLRANGHDAFAKAMTKRHFEDAAAYMRDKQSSLSPEEHGRHVDTLVNVFRGQNPRFDEGRFRAASRGEGSRGGVVKGHTKSGRAVYQGGRPRPQTGASRKHFNAAAAYLRSQQSSMSPEEHDRHIDTLVNTFRTTNPRFDEGRFRAACKAPVAKSASLVARVLMRKARPPMVESPRMADERKAREASAKVKAFRTAHPLPPGSPAYGTREHADALAAQKQGASEPCAACHGTGQSATSATCQQCHGFGRRPGPKGEGSRGGTVVGHTPRGKARYQPRPGGKMTLGRAREHLRGHGMHIKRTEGGDFRVAHPGGEKSEASAYYTNDLDDAVETGKDMARRKAEGEAKKSRPFDDAGRPLFVKSGEGSRGGHVIGHTKTGHPIYYGAMTRVRGERQLYGKTHPEHVQHAPHVIDHEGKKWVRAGHNSDTGGVSYDEHNPEHHVIDPGQGYGDRYVPTTTHPGGKRAFHLGGIPKKHGGNIPDEIHDPHHGTLKLRGWNSDSGQSVYHRAEDHPEWNKSRPGSIVQRVFTRAVA